MNRRPPRTFFPLSLRQRSGSTGLPPPLPPEPYPGGIAEGAVVEEDAGTSPQEDAGFVPRTYPGGYGFEVGPLIDQDPLGVVTPDLAADQDNPGTIEGFYTSCVIHELAADQGDLGTIPDAYPGPAGEVKALVLLP